MRARTREEIDDHLMGFIRGRKNEGNNLWEALQSKQYERSITIFNKIIFISAFKLKGGKAVHFNLIRYSKFLVLFWNSFFETCINKL